MRKTKPRILRATAVVDARRCCSRQAWAAAAVEGQRHRPAPAVRAAPPATWCTARVQLYSCPLLRAPTAGTT